MRKFSMLQRLIGLMLALSAAAMLSAPARAQDASQDSAQQDADAIYQSRADDIVALINGTNNVEVVFASAFLAAVPADQLTSVAQNLSAQNGQATAARVVGKQAPFAGQIEIDFPTGVAQMEMVLEPAAPHKIVGLRISGFQRSGDSFQLLSEEFGALPGFAGFAVSEIRPQGIRPIAGHNADGRFAIGSTFKLYILAEAADQVKRGKRKWSDVVPLTIKSLPSGMIQDWPTGSPITLHSLASLMISISDNTATDTLLYAVGRDKVGERVAKSGHSNPADMIPFLGTREAFSLKMPALAPLRVAFEDGDDKAQGALLTANRDTLTTTQVDPTALVSAPAHIDTIEWFASPNDLVKLLAHMQGMQDETMLGIMGINKGLRPADAGRWRYFGFKGGSETGVINLTFLGQRPDGRWFAITGSWNNAAAAVDDQAFVDLMTRLVNVAVTVE